MDAATATPPTDFVPRAAHVQLAGDLDTEQTPVKVKGTWAYARSTAMGAKGVELPFSYERTRAATPADVHVKVPDQKKKKKAPQRHPATDAAKAASAANAALKADADRAVEEALEAADAGRSSPREPWEGFYEGSFVLRRHGRDAPVAESFALWRASEEWTACEDGNAFFDKEATALHTARGVGINSYGKFHLRGAVFDDGRLRLERSYAAAPKRKVQAAPRRMVSVPLVAPPRSSTRERKSTHVFDNSAEPSRRRGAESSSDEEGDAERELKRKRRRERDAIRRAKRRAEGGHESDSSDDVAYSGPQPAQQTIEWRAAYHDHTSDEVYCGEVAAETGLRHGLGVVVYLAHEHRIYEGEWRHGREHGRGVLLAKDRTVLYDGEFTDGRLHGRGICYLPNGATYRGDFRENARHGRGEYRSPRGGFYVGDWKDNKRHGRGRFELPDGSVYDGEWVRDARHGKGTLDLPEGTSYRGTWVEDRFEGRGECISPDGSVYEGTWRAGKREGRGAVKWPNGANYEGRFKDDKIDGQGALRLEKPVPLLEAGGGGVRGWLVPVELKADLARVHQVAGFDDMGL